MEHATFSRLFPPSTHGPHPVVLLDGGMGTTLQAPPFELKLDSALWSSELLATEEGKAQLTKLHEAWIEAGADIVETCTYQSSLPLFLPPSSSSYSDSTLTSALSTMTAALPVAVSCCSSSSLPSSSSSKKPVAALSLGPYGSSLQPGQEYGGLYPAPFGPAGASYTSTTPSKPACPEAALDAAPLPLDLVRLPAPSAQSEHELHLAAWHLRRLLDFSSSSSFDSPSLALLAFETVPLLAEARAIRRAVAAFNAHPSHAGKRGKAWYISFVFPRVEGEEGGDAVRFPDPAEEAAALPSLKVQAEAIVAASLGDLGEGYATPGGIGFNCTSPLHAKAVVAALSAAVAALPLKQREEGKEGEKPWLFLYPDGGATYDVHTRSWHTPEGLTDEEWAVLVADAAAAGRAAGVWGGVGVGGCCKAGPGAIAALGREVRGRGWRE
ncbi:hypothetical protein JCM6882_008930 [Rhodosporidiobolus microsporus]